MERKLQDPPVSLYFIYWSLGCCITLYCLCLYDTGFFYDTNIQYTQLLHWTIRQTQFYYSISLILVHSTDPYFIYYLYFWAALLDQLHSWFSLSTQFLLLSAQFLVSYTSPYFFCSWSRLLDQPYYTGPL